MSFLVSLKDVRDFRAFEIVVHTDLNDFFLADLRVENVCKHEHVLNHDNISLSHVEVVNVVFGWSLITTPGVVLVTLLHLIDTLF
jgi:hypothetical protein